MSEPIRDWRGTEIVPGQTVVYGGPVGRSVQIQQVEGQVEGFTGSGRVRVRVIRRSYMQGEKDIVHVGADRLTVVEKLPDTEKLTQAQETAAQEERRRIRATHDFPPFWLNQPSRPYGGSTPHPDRGGPCRTCGLSQSLGSETRCATED